MFCKWSEPQERTAPNYTGTSVLPDFKYCIVGDGKERQPLQELAQTLGVADRVLFVGRKPAGFRFLQLADIFVMPSYSEGFPLAMLEAASMQKLLSVPTFPYSGKSSLNRK